MNRYDLTQIEFKWVANVDGYAKVISNALNKKDERFLVDQHLRFFGNYRIVEEKNQNKYNCYITNLPFGMFKEFDEKLSLKMKEYEKPF